MGENSVEILRAYLQSHESDIAWSVNDFGLLNTVFSEVVGRPVKSFKSVGLTGEAFGKLWGEMPKHE